MKFQENLWLLWRRSLSKQQRKVLIKNKLFVLMKAASVSCFVRYFDLCKIENNGGNRKNTVEKILLSLLKLLWNRLLDS